MSWLLNLVVSFLARIFKDWRRDGALRDLGAAEQAQADLRAAAEAKDRADAEALAPPDRGATIKSLRDGEL